MAKDNEPVVPKEEVDGKKQEDCFNSEDLECRSQNLGLALMRKKALKKRGYRKEGGEPQGTMARAIKLSSEFLASIIVGVVLGLGFDQLAGSLPWGLVFFLFLGFAAGVLSILRSVGYIAFSQLGQKGASRQDKGADKRSDK
ncbi:AtpZ/AtpI family protein [Bartonella henselae]|uniref:AtpZ/AtpI family protein n=1 Tax=Bartonella henselae TaxID=38323 RepID=UPI0009667055|nr:AtpZ/AtpI family protein [Bartonella henselae]OLL54072.1 ATP synthase I [Bartonella henselae]OLL54372.1 ATP synthase I [Bartonella henselae]UJM32785.1 AtpZ/AtpI family protein [Bartonella henselae]